MSQWTAGAPIQRATETSEPASGSTRGATGGALGLPAGMLARKIARRALRRGQQDSPPADSAADQAAQEDNQEPNRSGASLDTGGWGSQTESIEHDTVDPSDHAARGEQVRVQQLATPAPARAPTGLVSHTFLGKACGGGVNPTLKQRLVMVEARLREIYDAQDPDARDNPITGEVADNFEAWCGIQQPHGCWRPNAGYHSSGAAIDINYTSSPYIATRTSHEDSKGKTTTVLGGEAAGAGLQGQRQGATEVYDRAVRFSTYAPDASSESADVSARGKGETTGSVYDRFKRTSDALKTYFAPAFLSEGPTQVNRQTIASPEKATLAQLLAAIPETERKAEADARSEIQAILDSEWAAYHEDWPDQDVDSMYLRMLRDYELVRAPMVFGNPAARPASTRNPSKGFMSLRKELVEALCDVGQLRWGASDFGERESGDIMHFDLGAKP